MTLALGAKGTLRILAVAAMMGGLPVAVQAQRAVFYEATAAEIAGETGTLIRNEKIDDSPYGGQHYRVLYRSRGLKGEPIAVSGMIFAPSGDLPEDGWPIVAWAHPTSGLVPKCAPSVAGFGVDQVQGLKALLDKGYVVTATDYPGLGTPGPHPFLVGASEGRAVLDSIRAARDLMGGKGGDAVLWGHSQGGQAVLYAADLAKSYAPELKILGVGAAAPATELKKLLDDDIDTPGGRNLLAMTLWAWSKVFDAPLADVVEPAAMPTLENLANVCLESPLDLLPRAADGSALMKTFLSVDEITDLEPWKSLMDQNTIGALPTNIPVMLVQGTDDDTVPPAVTASYMTTLCRAGSNVTMLTLPGASHMMAAHDGAPSFVEWITGLYGGTSPTSDCP